MDIPFTKMHGLGNDFVVIDNQSLEINLTSTCITKIADRRRGIGFDQLLTLEPARESGDLFLDIKNPDGTSAEACGNGTRCVASLMMNERETDLLRIETVGGLLVCERRRNGDITVDMGEPRTNWQEIPLARETDALSVKIDNRPHEIFTCVNMGNPHAVLFSENCEEVELEKIGPEIECHEMFPDRINVEFATVQNKSKVRVRVWERGAGQTAACGSGACAVLVAAVLRGLTERKAEVVLDGGPLLIERRDNNRVSMTGPTEISFNGSFSI